MRGNVSRLPGSPLGRSDTALRDNDEQWELIAEVFPPWVDKGRTFGDHGVMVNAFY
ncbi:MAG TPA: hypothetical protein VJY33_11850 [Isosphaeraceae bacterium]|nr:hypothetical protein [Isosphaeraceae bacterium]